MKHDLAPPTSLCNRCGRVVTPGEDFPCVPDFLWTAPSSHHWMSDVAYSGLRHDVYVTTDGNVYDGCDAGCNGTRLAVVPEPRQRHGFGERIYAASRASVPERPQMWRNLRDHAGYKIISSWIDEAGPGETASMEDLWTRVLREIEYCTRLVLYVEPDDFPLKGALVEVGIALGCGKPVYVVAPRIQIGADYRPIGSWLAHRNVVLEHDMVAALGPLPTADIHRYVPSLPTDTVETGGEG